MLPETSKRGWARGTIPRGPSVKEQSWPVKPGFPEILAFGPTGYGDELLWGAAMSVSIAVLAYALGLLIGIVGALSQAAWQPAHPRHHARLHDAGARRAGADPHSHSLLCRHGHAEPAAGELRASRPLPSTASLPPCWCWASCRAPIRRKCCAPRSRQFRWARWRRRGPMACRPG